YRSVSQDEERDCLPCPSNYLVLSDEVLGSKAATNASLSPLGLSANRVMPFNPLLEKSATSCHSRSFFGSNLKSLDPLAERMIPSGVQTKSSLPVKVLVKTSALRVLRSSSLISHSSAEILWTKVME